MYLLYIKFIIKFSVYFNRGSVDVDYKNCQAASDPLYKDFYNRTSSGEVK